MIDEFPEEEPAIPNSIPPQKPPSEKESYIDSKKDAPYQGSSGDLPSRRRNRTPVHDTMVEVMISVGNGPALSTGISKSLVSDSHVEARMIISIWMVENQRYYTLSFTSSPSLQLAPSRSHSRAANRDTPTPRSSPALSTGSKSCSNCGFSPSAFSPAGGPISSLSFPPLGAPSQSNIASTPSGLQKTLRMKDAMLSAMEIPAFVLWKDESLALPNASILQLVHEEGSSDEDTYDLLSRFKVYTPDFERLLEPEEYPIVQLCRTQKPFKSWKIGLIDGQKRRLTYEINGKGAYDDKTGEFLAGVITMRDVTEYANIIKSQADQNEQQFELICDTMPQMLWTTTPSGFHG